MKVIRKPETKGLKGKNKKTFLANTKIIINKLNNEVENENRNIATRLDRLSSSSEINPNKDI